MNELKVLKQCQNGNKQAFNELITFYYPFVYKFLLKITNKNDVAEDMTHETFLKLIKNIYLRVFFKYHYDKIYHNKNLLQ